MKDARIEAYIMYGDGCIDSDCSDAGMIWGVHYAKVSEILDEVITHFGDYFFDYAKSIGFDDPYDILEGHGMISFNITNINWDEGQQSFPEEGLWDYLPHWEFSIEVTDHKKFVEIENYVPYSRASEDSDPF